MSEMAMLRQPPNRLRSWQPCSVLSRMGNPLYPVDYDDIRVVCPVRNCAAVDAHGYIFIVLFDQARPRHERIAAQVTWRAPIRGNAEQRRAEAEAALSAPHFCVQYSH